MTHLFAAIPLALVTLVVVSPSAAHAVPVRVATGAFEVTFNISTLALRGFAKTASKWAKGPPKNRPPKPPTESTTTAETKRPTSSRDRKDEAREPVIKEVKVEIPRSRKELPDQSPEPAPLPDREVKDNTACEPVRRDAESEPSRSTRIAYE
jgi:hypothetical protein